MTDPAPSEALWYIPPTVVKLADGATMIRPGKAILRAKPAYVSKVTGVSPRSLQQLAECGLIRRSNPTPGVVWYYPQEVHDLIKRTEEDLDFWDEVKRKAFLTGSRLSEAETPPKP